MNPFQLLHLTAFATNSYASMRRNAEIMQIARDTARASRITAAADLLKTLPIVGEGFKKIAQIFPNNRERLYNDSVALRSYPLEENPLDFLLSSQKELIKRIELVSKNTDVCNASTAFLQNGYPVITTLLSIVEIFTMYVIVISIINFCYFNKQNSPLRLFAKKPVLQPTTKPVVLALVWSSSKITIYLPLIPARPSYSFTINFSWISSICFLALFCVVFLGFEYTFVVLFAKYQSISPIDLQLSIVSHLMQSGGTIDFSLLNGLNNQSASLVSRLTKNTFKAVSLAAIWSVKNLIGGYISVGTPGSGSGADGGPNLGPTASYPSSGVPASGDEQPSAPEAPPETELPPVVPLNEDEFGYFRSDFDEPSPL